MEADDGFDTAEEVKLIEEDILLPLWVCVGLGELRNASSRVCGFG